jgi:orotidine 5'-phosphate decarboxylase subfamily 1
MFKTVLWSNAFFFLMIVLQSNAHGNHNRPDYLSMSYAKRADLCTNGVAKKLFMIMEEKQTNLAIAADVTSVQQLIALVQAVGPYICMLKLHIDILEDFDPATIITLQHYAQKYNFIVLEDRKFADTGNTVQNQYTGGLYHIADWADLVTVHAVAGSGMIEHMKLMVNTNEHGAIMLAQMSTTETLAHGHYTDHSIAIGNQHNDFIVGFITRSILDLNPAQIRFTPGISLKAGVCGDQNYMTPEQAILEDGSDVLIVGRGIYGHANPEIIAQEYRIAGWNAYQKRINSWSISPHELILNKQVNLQI